MVTQVPIVAKIRMLQGQIELTQQAMAMFDPLKPEKYPGEHKHYQGFRYQEEVFIAILEDYKQKLKEEQNR